ncbi:hypothetical protein ID866_2563 [Astraeus odoratus]|nr:hypothetical protein ID866_2563 [Astraeus odoratus]
MRVLAAVLLSVSSVLAYQVTYPGGTQGWTTTGPNYLKWDRVSTDPLNFTAVLTNQNTAVMPLNNQVLNALVDGTLGVIECNPPSGGWPVGDGFRVNLAQDAQHLDSLLAQSDEFSIAASSSTGSVMSMTSTQSASSSNSALTPSATSPSTTPTSSDTSTSPTSSSAALAGVDAKTGLLTALAALTAFITTAF